jgi:hypothetical protein
VEELAVSGIVRAIEGAQAGTVAGYRVAATVTRLIRIDPGRDDTLPVESTASTVVDAEGRFSLAIGGEGAPSGEVTVTVASQDGQQVALQRLSLEEVRRPLTLRVEALPTLTIDPAAAPGRGERLTLTGRVIDTRGTPVPANVPVVLWGVSSDDATQTPRALIVTQTQPGGFFSADWLATTLESGFGRVAGSAPIPIELDDERLPRRVLLVLEVPDDAAGDGEHPPRAPDPIDLTRNPAAFSQDLGRGCIDLCTPNRTIEEFVYTQVVRTSEPEVRGVTLGVRRLVPPKLLAELVQAATMHETMLRGAIREDDVAALGALSLDVDTARTLAGGDHPPALADIRRAAWLSEFSRIKDLIGATVSTGAGRQQLDADHAIDWDETPTIHEAITIARGHLLEFREVWRADGYSLGDLLYSLPLAPGQRRQVAIVDWERRSTTVREEALEFEEQLNAFLERDRDVSEIVGSRLAEESAGASRNTTWGVSGGIGAGFIGTGFGIFGGVAGSSGGSSSNAWQDSSRRFSADSLQSLRDRVMQRASSVRDQRATVVQTAAQGESMRTETETIANWNRCHAMTVEYFEVLRHFVVTHEVADVRECLFVPMPMREFNAGKALRWQTPLTGRLRDRALLPAFDAMRRIADNWEGWDWPLSRYSEEPPQVLEGELRISFVLPRPRDKDDGTFQVDLWDDYRPWLWMDPYELWTKMIQEGIADANAAEIAKRDRNFREKVAPEIARRVMDRLRFWYVTIDGGEVEVPLDATLVSRYAEGVPLYVTLRPSGGLPAISREKISQFKITLDAAALVPDAQLIVHTGKVRYRTEHKAWVLFDNGRILNDLSNGDPVYVSTPVSWAETRNPRQEDRDLRDRLIAHLNASLEYYHQVIWMWLDAERRFMLLDGILVPGLGGKSVASIVENRVIGIAGNSLILPLAPGIRIDPRVNGESEGDLRDLYAADSPAPVRVSVPTRGVYAEAILGECQACEEIDDSRYWRWTAAGMLAPPSIEPVGTESRAEAEDPLTATPLPKPLVSIQAAPELPNPVGLGEILKILAKPDLFTDITGLEGTQKNARAGFDAALSAVSGIASQAAGMAKQEMAARDGERMLDRIDRAQRDGLLSPQVAQDLSQKVFGAMVGTPDAKADKKADSPVADPAVQKALDKAAQSDKAAVKVSTLDETIEMSFDGGDTAVGGAGSTSPGLLELTDWMPIPVVVERPARAVSGFFEVIPRTIDKLPALEAADPRVPAIKGKFLRAQAGDPTKFELFGRLRIVYPADASNPKKVGGKGRLPIAVLVHGQHASWDGGETRNHDGYSYLQEHLARQNIVSVAVDTNAANFYGSLLEMRARIILRALDTMRALDRNSSSAFFNRLDFDRVGLMGHSRGGDAVAYAAKLNAGNAHGVIRCVALVAPTDTTGWLPDGSKNVLGSAQTGFAFVLYGGLDGDVSGAGGARDFWGTGFRHYDRATTDAAMVYVPQCNHNRFNRTWSTDDDGTRPGDIAKLHSRADHEQLMIEYVGGLFEWKLGGVGARAGLFNGMATNTLGHTISLQWKWGAQRRAIDEFENPAAADIGPRTLHATDQKMFADVTINGATIAPNTAHFSRVATISKKANVPVAIEIEPAAGARDWRGYELLTLRVATWMKVGSEADINNGTSPPVFTIRLIDGANKAGAVPSVGFTTPDIPGKPVFHEVDGVTPGSVVNCTLHRFATVAITLTGFGVDLGDVRKLQIVPDPSFDQPVFIDSLQLVKP